MSVTKGTPCGAFLRNCIAVLALGALLVPQAVCAESLLLLFKEDTSSTAQWREVVRQNSKKPAVFSLNANGDLVVKCGSLNMVLAYSPAEDPHKQTEPVRVAMVMNQDAPPISGMSIKLNFTF